MKIIYHFKFYVFLKSSESIVKSYKWSVYIHLEVESRNRILLNVILTQKKCQVK